MKEISAPGHAQIIRGISAAFDMVTQLPDEASGSSLSSCVLFCDSAGYEPQWAKSMGERRAHSKCATLVTVDDYGARDYWCSEFFGYMVDK